MGVEGPGVGGRAEVGEVLAAHLVDAVRAAGGYGGGVYLRSADRRSLVLAVVAGVPRSLMKAWWRVPVSGALPMSAAYRTGEPVHLADEGETMRRFPQMSVGLPYPFASEYQPVRANGEVVGVFFVKWSTARAARLRAAPDADRMRLGAAAEAVGAALGGVPADRPLEYDGDPVGVRLPAEVLAVEMGMVDWDLDSGAFTADEDGWAVLGIDPADFDGTIDRLKGRVCSDDLPELRAAERDAREGRWIRGRRFRVSDVREGEGRYRPIELWGRGVRGADEAGRPSHRVLALVVDAVSGPTAAEAAERLPDGVFSLDQDGRTVYANHRCEQLLRCPREELLGRYPWRVLTWLSDPAYEDRYRAAMLSQEPTSFLVRHPAGEWLGFILYPDVHGLTGRVFPSDPPPAHEGHTPATAHEPSSPVDTATAQLTPTRPGALYHVVQMASVLTEAVTVREVCRAVADQLLPAFGGQEVALYLVRDRRMHLAWESGYPEGFLDPFEGVSLDAHLPGVEALTSGAPIFFESRQRLSGAYPGIALDRMHSWAFLPLIASGHPVGSCILGYVAPHTFTPDERAALTALGGLVAQALERARLYDAEFTLARGLQDALLPHRLPPIAGLRTAGRYLPGTQGMEIGGDWYDVIETGSGVALVIGDVEGHSVAAAAVMGQLRSAVNALATSAIGPREVVGRTNRLLADLDAGVCATCCYIELDPSTGHGHAVRAGHPPPVLRHPDGRTDVLDLPGGVMLGVHADAGYPVTPLELPRGGILALYTDGLVEQPGQDIETGIQALSDALARGSPDTLETTADTVVQEARRAEDRPDDVALLLTAYIGAHS
ncbi:SpoIIE family protein phosphatase [Streptomyces sp. LX-29]|uniref:SpoIIE family protein phosphatase n=1 Tax=Streptomyces sp. LX-29 TaxID=2900152 RepID=UPI00240DBCF7|nr:SpoIIE family protein phosphatase [Streptomyces sp. LX-29]WFB07615.1 SpoIIE family protein phosphatase [Streptomyces sp. LX-29]